MLTEDQIYYRKKKKEDPNFLKKNRKRQRAKYGKGSPNYAKTLKYHREYQRKHGAYYLSIAVEELHDWYIRGLLKRAGKKRITAEMIKVKRAALKKKRAKLRKQKS